MIDRWDTGALDTLADSLGKRTTAMSEVETGLRVAGPLPGWFGEGANAGRELHRLTADSLLDEAAVLDAARQLAVEPSAAQAANIDSDAKRIFTAIREGIITAGDATTIDQAGETGAKHEALREETLKQLDLDGRKDDTVSTISWLGYEPPSGDGSRPPFYEFTEAGQQDRAKDGADDLNEFYRTLDVASTKDDPHIVAFGHSYGSVTQGLALQDGPHTVDDAVFYGSPGFAAEDEPELGLRQGHGFVMEGSDDDIRFVKSRGVVDFNGPNPTETRLVQLATGEYVAPDGTRHDASRSHAEYGRDGSNGELRTRATTLRSYSLGYRSWLCRGDPIGPIGADYEYLKELRYVFAPVWSPCEDSL
ncbi:alpha/beta hydrolase [Williamsia soli]|uniref:alpha/beta hydrolase n=1 Tax=Williamsia soli TaxID=364929 RepID=UPI001F1838DC|nr:alpha/beta hydrolase [Williamsia soli]